LFSCRPPSTACSPPTSHTPHYSDLVNLTSREVQVVKSWHVDPGIRMPRFRDAAPTNHPKFTKITNISTTILTISTHVWDQKERIPARQSAKEKAPRGARTHSLKMTARSGNDRYRSLARYHCASRAGMMEQNILTPNIAHNILALPTSNTITFSYIQPSMCSVNNFTDSPG
jgi:hypothetical protein